MNKIELKQRLSSLGISDNYYSLEGYLDPDRVILFNSYEEWSVFYLDERGNRTDLGVFLSENDACQWIYEHFKKLKEEAQKYGFNI